MGTAKYQITRVDDLHGLYRYGFTGTSGYCPTYSAITAKSWYKVKFNTETTYPTMTFSECPAYKSYYTGVQTYGQHVYLYYNGNPSSYPPIPYYIGTNYMCLFDRTASSQKYGNNIILSGLHITTSGDTAQRVLKGCLFKANVSLTGGFTHTGTISFSFNPIFTSSLSGYEDGGGADYTSYAAHTYNSTASGSGTAWYLYVFLSSNTTEWVYYNTSSSYGNITFSYTVPSTGTYYFCLVPGNLYCNTQYSAAAYNALGYLYHGLYFYISPNQTMTLPNRSYSSTMLVRHMDISIVNTRTLTVKVYNNKGTQAKLDSIKAYYDTSTSETTSGTQCGSLSIGNVSSHSTASYSLSITIPASIINTTSKYYVHIYCGATNSTQTWSYKFGSGTYSSTTKVTSRVTTGIQVCRTVSTNTAQYILPNIFGSSPMSEMTFQIK